MRFKFNPITCEYCCGRIPQRVILAIMLHFALQNNYSIRVVLNIAIVEMVEPPPQQNLTENACPQYDPIYVKREGGKFPWPQRTRSLVLYSFFVGYLFSGIPGGWLADKYGGRWVMAIVVLSSSLSNAIFPFSTKRGGYIVAVFLRGVLGLVQGGVLPVISSFVSTWVPPSERTVLGGISYGGSNLGTIMGSIFTGLIIEHFNNWTFPFYFWSFVSLCYVALHMVTVFSYPSTHPFISEEELTYLNTNIITKRKLKTPWRAIMTNIPYWANIFAQFGHNYIFFQMVTWLPTYMKDVLQFDIAENGLLSALPFCALWISSLILSFTGNYLVNVLNCMSPHTFSKIFGTSSNIVSAVLVLGAVYMECNRQLCITLYVVGMCTKAFYYMTLPVNINELSKNYGGVMFGICNSIGGFSGIVGNAIIGGLTKNNKFSEWKLAFWITLGVEIGTSVVYIIWSSSERQPFDYQEEEVTPE